MIRSILILLVLTLFNNPSNLPDSKLATNVRNAVWPRILDDLHSKDIANVSSVYIRIFKEEHILEIWVKGNKQYQLFKTYPICFFSGGLGTKTRENDGKSPEGFYIITAGQLNPVSNYHLAINIGYPNKLEKANGYTDSAIMIHGHCASIGCYAMTDPYIEEIYTIAYKALASGQKSIPLHIFPFRLSVEKIRQHGRLNYFKLWNSMKPAYDDFEKWHLPQVIVVVNKTYKLQVE
jgi:murein L,D-transpeptidase YafK